MTKTRLSDVQVARILKEVELSQACRKRGINEPMHYKWRSEFLGMGKSHLTLLCQLQDENAKFKLMYAGLALQQYNRGWS